MDYTRRYLLVSACRNNLPLLVLPFPLVNSCTCYDRKLNVGDMVMLKDPIKSDKYLVRRLAATEGYEMASTDEKDESFVLEENECWVLADNEEVKPKVNIVYAQKVLFDRFI